MQHRLSIENIERAASEIDAVFTNTPQFNCEPLSKELGAQLTLKSGNAQPNSKLQGQRRRFFMSETKSTLQDQQLVCATAGNFGQAMAYACRKRSRHLIIYSATNANPLKIERMCSMGAEVRQEGDNFDGSKESARRSALRLARTSLKMVVTLQFPRALDR